jgi:hypothetical protein
MSLCILSLGQSLALSVELFSLSWTHSVEGTRWEEKWRVSEVGLQIIEARIKGSGAGMEPSQGAVLQDGWWVFRPAVRPQKKLILAASGDTQDGWTLCANGACRTLGASPGEPIILRVCSVCQATSPGSRYAVHNCQRS